MGVIRGVIARIYTPGLNHGMLRVEIRNYTGSIVYHEESMMLDYSFYKEIAVGDSIVKNKGLQICS